MKILKQLPKYSVICIGIYLLDIISQLGFTSYFVAGYEKQSTIILNISTIVFVLLRLAGCVSIILFTVNYYRPGVRINILKKVFLYSIVFFGLSFVLAYVYPGLTYREPTGIDWGHAVSNFYPILFRFVLYGTILRTFLLRYAKKWLVFMIQILSLTFLPNLFDTILQANSLFFLPYEARQIAISGIWQTLKTISFPKATDVFILMLEGVFGPFGILAPIFLVYIKGAIGMYSGYFESVFWLNTIISFCVVVGLYLKLKDKNLCEKLQNHSRNK